MRMGNFHQFGKYNCCKLKMKSNNIFWSSILYVTKPWMPVSCLFTQIIIFFFGMDSFSSRFIVHVPLKKDQNTQKSCIGAEPKKCHECETLRTKVLQLNYLINYCYKVLWIFQNLCMNTIPNQLFSFLFTKLFSKN